MLSNVKILKKKFSFSSQIRDFEKNSLSLLERMRFCKQILFLFSILHSMSFPILVRNHILLFGLILTISVLQKGKVFLKDSSVLLSNILTSVYKSTSWRLLRPRVISGSILNGCPVERAYAKHARMRSEIDLYGEWGPEEEEKRLIFFIVCIWYWLQ